jgi:internalin A
MIAKRGVGVAEAERRIAEWKAKSFVADNDPEPRGLHLPGLGLKEVPESVRDLKDLEYLLLSSNEIEELPQWIGELKALEYVNLTGNRLRRLPDELTALTHLKVLWLLYNRLEELPDALQHLPLEKLELHGNRELGLPEDILNLPPREILRYYFESHNEKGSRLQEVKLLVVGRGKAGKTTLVKRLAGEVPDTYESETHSIAIRELMLSCPSGDVRAHAWDFGGQEILHSTHQFFLTDRSLYLLVLEPRTGMAQRDAEYWLKLIETQGSASPTIVALNWSHDRPWRIDEIRLRRKYPFIVDFVSTDALHGDGIEKLRETIVKTVEKMPEVWLPFPRRWREIKDAVAGMRDNFLSYRQYTALCEKYGEKRPAAQADLAGILHALGLVLYFGRDPRLHDTRVLNPSWVTGGVYAVLRAPSIRQNGGLVALQDMPRILREAEDQHVLVAADYPTDTHRFILEFMRAFQLCYASDEEAAKPTRYLIPELLPAFEPEMKDDWEQGDVRLRYRYDMLPPGLLPKFIVRTHGLSEAEPHWRHGVVLRHAEARALIREEPDRQELHVFALGGDADTRRLLVAIVRRELEALHAELKMQPVEELELSAGRDRWISVKTLREVEEPQKPTQKMAVQPEGVLEVHVEQELDKLLPPEARAIDRKPDTAPVPVRLFVGYAPEDERQLKRLDAILDILEQQHGLVPWRDRRLIAGEEWDEQVRQRLEEMDIFLFIASQASLVRPYIREELRRARERQAAGEVEIVTVKLEPCPYEEDPSLGKIQRLAANYKSVAEVSPRSVAWEQVRKDLLSVIARVREKKKKIRTI